MTKEIFIMKFSYEIFRVHRKKTNFLKFTFSLNDDIRNFIYQQHILISVTQ